MMETKAEPACSLRPFYIAQDRLRQMVELFYLGKTDIHLRAPALAPCRNQLRQAVQRLRPEHHIHIRRAFYNRFAFLAGDTAAHADHEAGPRILQRAPAPVPENSFSCAFSRTEQVLNRSTSAASGASVCSCPCRTQHVRHLPRVVLVHLAAKGFNVEFFLARD